MSDEHPLDLAEESLGEVCDALEDTDGGIASMMLAGRVGYHLYVATGETNPEYLWKIAFLQALEETLLQEPWIDGDTPAECRQELESQIGDTFDHWTRDPLLDEFESRLEELMAKQSEVSA